MFMGADVLFEIQGDAKLPVFRRPRRPSVNKRTELSAVNLVPPCAEEVAALRGSCFILVAGRPPLLLRGVNTIEYFPWSSTLRGARWFPSV